MHSFSFVTEIPERVKVSKSYKKSSSDLPNSLSAILYLSFALRFLHLLCFSFFCAALLSSTGAHILLCLLGLLAGQSIKFFCCAHAAAFACADKMEASIGHINMQGPQTQKKSQQGDCKDRRHLHCKVQKTRQYKEIS